MIRKQNSDFVTAFTSESGGNIKNSDCFAFVELEGLACYIVADGIDDVSGENSAKMCVDAVVTAFTENPSMKKRKLKKYMNVAHATLRNAKSKDKLKASVTILVHNYVKMRYCQGGNVRFRLYRNGFLKFESKDHSLSKDLVDSHKLEKDKLITHEERHNLYSYLGQDAAFSPWVSKKIKLTPADAISLTTRGFWEHVDDGELLDLFQDATTDPKETVNTAEDMLLSKQPKNLRAFTFVTIFVNKTFRDPTRKQKWKKFWTFAIPILTILFIISMILYFRWRAKQADIEDMNEFFNQSVAYIEANNYVRGETTLEQTITYANKVKDSEMASLSTSYLMLVQKIILADGFLDKNNFHSAYSSYVDALKLSRTADLYAVDYISEKLDLTSSYIAVYDLISLGDTLALNYQYNEAEIKYLEAKLMAGKIYYDVGRQNAMTALETLYELEKSDMENVKLEAIAVVETETSATSFVAQGDIAFAADDFESALVFYSSALQKYTELEDEMNLLLVEEKLEMTKEKQDLSQVERNTAESYLSLGQSEQSIGNFDNSRMYYLKAQEVYTELGEDGKISEIDKMMEIVDLLESSKVAEALAAEEALKEHQETIQASMELEKLKAELELAIAKAEANAMVIPTHNTMVEVSEETQKEEAVTKEEEKSEQTTADLSEFSEDVIILG